MFEAKTALDKLIATGKVSRLPDEPPQGFFDRMQVDKNEQLRRDLEQVAIQSGIIRAEDVSAPLPPMQFKPMTLERALVLSAPHADGVKRSITYGW